MLVGSDGIGSIVGDGGAMFEDDELRRVLAELTGNDGSVVIEKAMKRALEFGNDRPLPDDVNLVAVTRV